MVHETPLDTMITTPPNSIVFRITVFIHDGHQADGCYHEEKHQQANHDNAEIINETKGQQCDKSCDTDEGHDT
jgi:hypothetical protein